MLSKQVLFFFTSCQCEHIKSDHDYNILLEISVIQIQGSQIVLFTHQHECHVSVNVQMGVRT